MNEELKKVVDGEKMTGWYQILKKVLLPNHMEYLNGLMEHLADRAAQATRERDIALITTHTEHEGGYCDTGEDMDWACRSECVDLAVKRLKEQNNALIT